MWAEQRFFPWIFWKKGATHLLSETFGQGILDFPLLAVFFYDAIRKQLIGRRSLKTTVCDRASVVCIQLQMPLAIDSWSGNSIQSTALRLLLSVKEQPNKWPFIVRLKAIFNYNNSIDFTLREKLYLKFLLLKE